MSWTSERARLAVTIRHHPDDLAAIQLARRDLRAARAEDYLRGVVGEHPPLTTEQRLRLVTVLAEAGEPA
jgi:hypothetical protein